MAYKFISNKNVEKIIKANTLTSAIDIAANHKELNVNKRFKVIKLKSKHLRKNRWFMLGKEINTFIIIEETLTF